MKTPVDQQFLKYEVHIFCLTRGLTRSWRNGDAQCCQLSNIADPFSNFFPFKKASKLYLVSENRPVLPPEHEVLLSQRTHTHRSRSLSASAQFLFSARQPAEKSSALIQLNTDIILLASLILHDASIAEITAQPWRDRSTSCLGSRPS